MKSLPPDDQPITAADETTISEDARFVEVTTQLEQVNNYFITTVGGSATTDIQAASVAGYTQAVCDIPPMMICNLIEADPTKVCSNEIGMTPGLQIRAKFQGPNTQSTPIAQAKASERLHPRRHGQIPIDLDSTPRFRALALLGRLIPRRATIPVVRASEKPANNPTSRGFSPRIDSRMAVR